jgi:hypothetical protein
MLTAHIFKRSSRGERETVDIDLFDENGDPFTGGGGEVEDWHVVGTAGEPAFGATWGGGSPAVAKFRKRPDGVVELRGFVVRTGGATDQTKAFTLPDGYRPPVGSDLLVFTTWSTSAQKAEVHENGDVMLFGAPYQAIDSIQFSVD